MIRVGEEKIIPSMPIVDASFPAPFQSGLEFSAPARGVWTIVHVGMLIPEAHEIFVCAAGCLRGVVLSAAEMNLTHRFSTVAIEEHNVLDGDMEDLLIEGVTDILNRLPKLPKAVLVYSSCIHEFMGCDLEMCYSILRDRFPEVDFTDCYMNPIMRKSGLTPDQIMRRQLYSLLRPVDREEKHCAIIGNCFSIDESSDIVQLIKKAGWKLHQITECKSYEEYLKMAHCSICISTQDVAIEAGDFLAEKMGMKHLFLPAGFSAEKIHKNLAILAETLGVSCDEAAPKVVPNTETGRGFEGMSVTGDKASLKDEFTAEAQAKQMLKIANDTETQAERMLKVANDIESQAKQMLKKASNIIGDTPIVIDYTFTPRPLELAKLLLTHGFNVKTIFADSFSGYEEDEFKWLQQEHPKIEIYPTVHASMRTYRCQNLESNIKEENTQSEKIKQDTENSSEPRNKQGEEASQEPRNKQGEEGLRDLGNKQDEEYLQDLGNKQDEEYLQDLRNKEGEEDLRDPRNKRCEEYLQDEKILAFGQKAAYFTDSPYFVNLVEGGGLYGFDGICKLAELMIDAFSEPKDVEKEIGIKGWGCESCL